MHFDVYSPQKRSLNACLMDDFEILRNECSKQLKVKGFIPFSQSFYTSKQTLSLKLEID